MFKRLAVTLWLGVSFPACAEESLWIDRTEARIWREELLAAERASGVPATVIAEVIGQESGFVPTAKNPNSTAYGCGQQIAGNRIMLAHKLDRHNCGQSIMGAALELRSDLDRTGTWDGALRAYGTTAGMSPSRTKAIMQRIAQARRYIAPIPPLMVAKVAARTG